MDEGGRYPSVSEEGKTSFHALPSSFAITESSEVELPDIPDCIDPVLRVEEQGEDRVHPVAG